MSSSPTLRQLWRRKLSLNLSSILHSVGLDPEHVLVVRHAYAKDQKDIDNGGIHPDSTYEDILGYTSTQSQSPRSFPSSPPAIWVVFLPEGGDRARLWGVLQNRGEVARDELNRQFDLRTTNQLADLCNRLVIGWNSPRTWKVKGSTAANYPVLEIADAQPVPFPGFDWLVLNHPQLQAVMREHRYASWRTALASVVGHLPHHRYPRRPSVRWQGRRHG